MRDALKTVFRETLLNDENALFQEISRSQLVDLPRRPFTDARHVRYDDIARVHQEIDARFPPRVGALDVEGLASSVDAIKSRAYTPRGSFGHFEKSQLILHHSNAEGRPDNEHHHVLEEFAKPFNDFEHNAWLVVAVRQCVSMRLRRQMFHDHS